MECISNLIYDCMNCIDVGCPIRRSNHIGFIVDESISIDRLSAVVRQWCRKYNRNLATHNIAYCAQSREFSQRYGLDFELDRYLSGLGKSSKNFWDDPTNQSAFVDDAYLAECKKNLIQYESSRRGLIIFIRNQIKPDWYDLLFSYAVSLDRSIAFDLAYECEI